MTTISFRRGILAADTMAAGDGVTDCEIMKIVANASGELAGATGDAGFMAAFLKWFKDGEKYERPKPVENTGFETIALRIDGEIEIYDNGGCFNISAEYYSIGSGKKFALGSMASGASAQESIRAAIKHDVHTGGGVTVLRIAGNT